MAEYKSNSSRSEFRKTAPHAFEKGVSQPGKISAQKSTRMTGPVSKMVISKPLLDGKIDSHLDLGKDTQDVKTNFIVTPEGDPAIENKLSMQMSIKPEKPLEDSYRKELRMARDQIEATRKVNFQPPMQKKNSVIVVPEHMKESVEPVVHTTFLGKQTVQSQQSFAQGKRNGSFAILSPFETSKESPTNESQIQATGNKMKVFNFPDEREPKKSSRGDGVMRVPIFEQKSLAAQHQLLSSRHMVGSTRNKDGPMIRHNNLISPTASMQRGLLSERRHDNVRRSHAGMFPSLVGTTSTQSSFFVAQQQQQ